MILSASRRTDIPAFYSEWFMNRIREGSVCVRNPFNANHISRVNIKPEVVDCIVFWTKNPKPLIYYLDEIDSLNYKYYFHFTLTPYDKDLELGIGDKNEIVKTFLELSNKIGKNKIILRYDPILITDKYTFSFHIDAFTKLCKKLCNSTDKVIVSFLDEYKKVNRNMKNISVYNLSIATMKDLLKNFALVAKQYNLQIETCAENIDLNDIGITKARCIDGELIENLIQCTLTNKNKLDGNRKDCGCMSCIDIGQYDSCVHNCLYCYATINKNYAYSNYKEHNSNSPILIGKYDEEQVKDRKNVKSFKKTYNDHKIIKEKQFSLFDNI